MGSGWFKTIISRKKAKQDRSKQLKGSASVRSNGTKWRLRNGASSGNPENSGLNIEDIAATRIQTAFRGFRARKSLNRLKGMQRLQVLDQGHSIKNQTSTTLRCLQSWSKIQSEIRARRACMVIEGRIKQKKQENQLKLEAELHDLQVAWCGSSETMEEILARIQQREEAAVKRERAMAYAFNHQWRANSGLNPGQFSYLFGKGNWGWSWMERWIAARPWETRLPFRSPSPKKAETKAAVKACKNTSTSVRRMPSSVKPVAVVGQGPAKRTSAWPMEEETVNQEPNHKPGGSSHPKTKVKQ